MTSKSFLRGCHLRSRATVVLATVLVVFWSGMPAMGCVCANGQFKPFCLAAHSPATKLGVATKHGDDSSEAKTESAHARVSCCHGGSKNSRRRSQCDGGPSGNEYCGNKNCCTPVLKAQAVAPVKDVDSHARHSVPFFDAVCVTNSWATMVRGASTVSKLDTGPQPIDLVVTLRRFVI